MYQGNRSAAIERRMRHEIFSCQVSWVADGTFAVKYLMSMEPRIATFSSESGDSSATARAMMASRVAEASWTCVIAKLDMLLAWLLVAASGEGDVVFFFFCAGRCFFLPFFLPLAMVVLIVCTTVVGKRTASQGRADVNVTR